MTPIIWLVYFFPSYIFFSEILRLLEENDFLTEDEVSHVIRNCPDYIQRLASRSTRKLLQASPGIKFNRVYYRKSKRGTSISNFSSLPVPKSPRLVHWLDSETINTSLSAYTDESSGASDDSVFVHHKNSISESSESEDLVISTKQDASFPLMCTDNEIHYYSCNEFTLEMNSQYESENQITQYVPSSISKPESSAIFSSVPLPTFRLCDSPISNTILIPGENGIPLPNLYFESNLSEKKNLVYFVLEQISNGSYFYKELLPEFSELWDTNNLDLFVETLDEYFYSLF